VELACAITARFSKGRDADSVELRFSNGTQGSRSVHVKPLAADQIKPDWIIA
ncbi:MAG: tRNA (5-methylaminomethyl-2-thiouridylate)-methyltransferase, partial [Gammaproteobacteria bacterium]